MLDKNSKYLPPAGANEAFGIVGYLSKEENVYYRTVLINLEILPDNISGLIELIILVGRWVDNEFSRGKYSSNEGIPSKTALKLSEFLELRFPDKLSGLTSKLKDAIPEKETTVVLNQGGMSVHRKSVRRETPLSPNDEQYTPFVHLRYDVTNIMREKGWSFDRAIREADKVWRNNTLNADGHDAYLRKPRSQQVIKQSI